MSSESRTLNPSAKPNILFILIADQDPWAMGCAGNSEIKTPNLDRIAATGIRYENFFCASPACSTARALIMTGRIPSQHAVHDRLCHGNTTIEKWNAAADEKLVTEQTGELIEYLAGMPGYKDILAADGYVCGLSGKWHMGDAHHAQKGYTFREAHAKGGGRYYNAPIIKDGEVALEPEYITDHFTNNALRFLEQQKDSDTPFYLGVHYTAPHTPLNRVNHPEETWDSTIPKLTNCRARVLRHC